MIKLRRSILDFGVWWNRLTRALWEREIVGSSPAIPTLLIRNLTARLLKGSLGREFESHPPD